MSRDRESVEQTKKLIGTAVIVQEGWVLQLPFWVMWLTIFQGNTGSFPEFYPYSELRSHLN